MSERFMKKQRAKQPSVQPVLTEACVREFVLNWYRELDVHAPVENLLSYLASDDLVIRLPETTLYSQDDFIKWYEGVIHKFFDEVHEMKTLDIQIQEEQANVKLVVNWQAHIWNAPAPTSQWLGFDAAQRWVVKASPSTNQPMIVTYIVDALIPMSGSPEL